MQIKAHADEIQSYLRDSSYMAPGNADVAVFPENAGDVSEVLARANRDRTPVTVSGAGTGTVGGRVPLGGVVLATDKLNRIESVTRKDSEGSAVAEAGVILRDLQHDADVKGLLYPPDPTERSCFLGGTIATNASGARTFKYGPTRKYVTRLKLALASGEILDLNRGELHADANDQISIPLPSGRAIRSKLPTYTMPSA